MRPLGLAALLLCAARGSHAQSAPARHTWQVTAGGSFMRVGDDALAFGPSIGFRAMLGSRFGLSLDGSVLVAGFSEFDLNPIGLAGNFGPTWAWRGVSHELSLSLGVSAVTKWKDETFPVMRRTQASTVGVYGAGGGVVWLGRAVGLSGTLRYHLWWGDPSASAMLGIALRW